MIGSCTCGSEECTMSTGLVCGGGFDDELLRSSTDVGLPASNSVKTAHEKTMERQDNGFCKLGDEIKDDVRER